MSLDFNCRIWGEQGQTALEKASICLLNCGPTGSEALKNLVLGGVGSITIIDGSKVEEGDLGNNFMGMLISPSFCFLFFCKKFRIDLQKLTQDDLLLTPSLFEQWMSQALGSPRLNVSAHFCKS